MEFKFDPEAARRDPRLGGIGARFAARIIDVFAVALVFSLLGLLVHPDVKANGLDFRLFVLSFAVSVLYEVPSTAIVGQTLGKRIMRIRVTRVEDGGMPGWGRALQRYFVVVVATYVPFLGILLVFVVQLWFLWDPRRQNIPDKVARTLVVKVGMELPGTDQGDVIDLP